MRDGPHGKRRPRGESGVTIDLDREIQTVLLGPSVEAEILDEHRRIGEARLLRRAMHAALGLEPRPQPSHQLVTALARIDNNWRWVV